MNRMVNMKIKKSWLYAALGFAAVVLALVWAFAPRPIEVEVASVTQGRFETTVDEDGKTRLVERYVVSAPLAGRLARITLREGDVVAAGDVLARLAPVLSPMLDERTRREQSARVEGAQAQVALAEARAERAKVGVQQADTELRRTEQLARQGFVAPTKLDTDRLAVAAARKELEAAQQQQHMAGHELQTARAALVAVSNTGSSAAARGFELRAPVAGRVLRLAQTSEATVTLGTPLLELGDTRQLEIVAELLTTDALQTPPGSRVIIERWGGPGTLEGKVRLVEPAAFTKVSALGVEEQRVNVRIDIASPPEQWKALGDGFRVSVRIVTLSADNAVRVPVSAVFPLPVADGDAASPAMAVFAFDRGRARQVPIVIGARNGTDAWVKSGLQPGAAVIIYPPAGVKEGVRVKQRKV
jgi:HlyD family secretion protein